MAPRVTRRSISAGVLVLLVMAFGAGAWVGADWVGRFYGYQALPRASAGASMLHQKLVQLDSADTMGLREAINMELDGELFGMCVLADAGSGSSRDDVAKARTVLKTIAKYRAQTPATYPSAYSARADEVPRKRLEACLDAALSAPGR